MPDLSKNKNINKRVVDNVYNTFKKYELNIKVKS